MFWHATQHTHTVWKDIYHLTDLIRFTSIFNSELDWVSVSQIQNPTLINLSLIVHYDVPPHPPTPMFLLAEVMFYKVQSKYMKWHFGFITPLDSSSTGLSAVRLPHSRIPSDEGRSPIARVRTWKRTSSCQMHLVTQTGSHTNKIKTERGRRGTASCHPLARDKKVEKWSASRWKISRVAVFSFVLSGTWFLWLNSQCPLVVHYRGLFFFFFLKVVRLLVFCVWGNQHTQGWKTPSVPLKKKMTWICIFSVLKFSK